MSRQTHELLEAYESLPAEDKRAFEAEVLRRAIPFGSDPFDEDEAARAADQVFSLLDQDEEESRTR
jgi:hypothetical protein